MIDLFTFLGPNSADYAEFMKYTSEKFLNKDIKVNWKCVNSVGCDRMPKGFEVVAQAENTSHVSMNHGVAINLAQKYVESDYVIFVDADVSFLYDGWNEVILNELNEYDCFGGEFGDWLKKFRHFPCVYFSSFRSSILDKVTLDFRPRLSKTGKTIVKHIMSQEEKVYFRMNKDVIRCDTGWSIPFQFMKHDLTFKSLDCIPMKSKKIKLPFESEKHRDLCMYHPRHMSEWHYNGELFAAHRHGSYGFPLNSKLGKAWKRRIELYIKNCGR
jgi:glycosyltransferase involved in cell wall biosynthesis